MWCRGGWTAVFEVFFGPDVSPEVSHMLQESMGHGKAGLSNLARMLTTWLDLPEDDLALFGMLV
ncbi:hypothetical protein M514_20284 [Trichuris suis]|uniref:Uncharacterized protein n=1 Tax=Trichuris suis TaxID=68888 RepID=A0A085NDR1_9BILA|nr:hypothetical protein M514_20284 [Trichuris suis]